MARTRQKKYTHKKRGNNRKTRRQRKSSRKTLLRKRVRGGWFLNREDIKKTIHECNTRLAKLNEIVEKKASYHLVLKDEYTTLEQITQPEKLFYIKGNDGKFIGPGSIGKENTRIDHNTYVDILAFVLKSDKTKTPLEAPLEENSTIREVFTKHLPFTSDFLEKIEYLNYLMERLNHSILSSEANNPTNTIILYFLKYSENLIKDLDKKNIQSLLSSSAQDEIDAYNKYSRNADTLKINYTGSSRFIDALEEQLNKELQEDDLAQVPSTAITTTSEQPTLSQQEPTPITQEPTPGKNLFQYQKFWGRTKNPDPVQKLPGTSTKFFGFRVKM